MGTFPDYDYFDWRDDLDIVSWDSYPAHDTTPAPICLAHDLMRAVGHQKPFMLMEQTPSRQNWQPYDSLNRPGQMRQQSWQAEARGADGPVLPAPPVACGLRVVPRCGDRHGRHADLPRGG